MKLDLDSVVEVHPKGDDVFEIRQNKASFGFVEMVCMRYVHFRVISLMKETRWFLEGYLNAGDRFQNTSKFPTLGKVIVFNEKTGSFQSKGKDISWAGGLVIKKGVMTGNFTI